MLIDAYLAGELSGDALAAFEARVRTDAAFRAELDAQRGLDAVLVRAFAPPTAAPVAPTPPPSRDDDKARKRREAEERQVRNKTLGPLEKRVTDLEERITAIETAQTGRSAELADPAVYADDARRKKLLKDYQSDQEKLEELTPRWEAAAQELEAARAKV